MRSGRAGLLLLALLAGSCSKPEPSWVIVQVRANGPLEGIRQLAVSATHAGGSRDVLVPTAPRAITLPTTFALRFDHSRSGTVSVVVRALAFGGGELLAGQASGTIMAGETTSLEVVLGEGMVTDAAVPDAAMPDATVVDAGQVCGNHTIEPPEVCDDGGGNNDVSGPCTKRCRPLVVWTKTVPVSTGLASGPGATLALSWNGASNFGVTRYDSRGVESWQAPYGAGPGSEGLGAAIDLLGNVILVGAEETGLATGANLGKTAVVLRFTPVGFGDWTRRYNNTSNLDAGALLPSARATRVVTDSQGNVIITGTESPGVSNSIDVMVRKYSPTGALLWTRTLGLPGVTDLSGSVAVDGNDNVIVVGSYSNSDGMMVKYDPAGTVAWTERIDSGQYDQVWDVAINSKNEIVVIGINAGSQNWIQAYSPSKAVLWTRFGNAGDVYVAVATDSRDDVIVAGTRVNSEVVVRKLDAAGGDRWLRLYAGSTVDLVVDDNDDIIVLGNGGSLRKYGP